LLGGYARPPWGTSRSINWGVDNITGGFNPQPLDNSHPAPMHTEPREAVRVL